MDPKKRRGRCPRLLEKGTCEFHIVCKYDHEFFNKYYRNDNGPRLSTKVRGSSRHDSGAEVQNRIVRGFRSKKLEDIQARGRSPTSRAIPATSAKHTTLLPGESLQYATMPDGHMCFLPFSEAQGLSAARCRALVKKKSDGCEHEVEVECWLSHNAPAPCASRCEEKLSCGHACSRRCSICKITNDDEKILKDHGECRQRCLRPHEPCEHQCRQTCHSGSLCPPCSRECSFSCPHQKCDLRCAVPCKRRICSNRCNNILGCGHPCPSVCGEQCPSSESCQLCAKEEIKNQEVEFIIGEKYRTVDLDVTPCLFFNCGHILTVETVDVHVSLDRYFHNNTPRSALKPFTIDDLKHFHCPRCRISTASFNRYNAVVKRFIYDQKIKNLTLWIHGQYSILCLMLRLATRALFSDPVYRFPGDTLQGLELVGPRKDQINKIVSLPEFRDRYQAITAFKDRIATFMTEVTRRERPILDLSGSNDNLPRTAGSVLGYTLLTRCNLAIITKMATLVCNTEVAQERAVRIDYDPYYADCEFLLKQAQQACLPVVEAEAHLLYARLGILEASRDDIRKWGLQSQIFEHLQRADDLVFHCKEWDDVLGPELEYAVLLLQAQMCGLENVVDEWTIEGKAVRQAEIFAKACSQEAAKWRCCENMHAFPCSGRECPFCGMGAPESTSGDTVLGGEGNGSQEESLI